MSWLSSFLHPERGYKNAQNDLNNYYQQQQNYLNPYNQNGQTQYQTLQDIIKNLSDPTELNKKWIESYNESPQAIQNEKIAQEHGLNAATAMGLGGSNTALNAIQQGTTQIGLNDRQNYLNDMMNKYKEAAGLATGVYNTGANAAGQQSNNAGQMGQNTAGITFGATNAPGEKFGEIGGKALETILSYLTGGMGTGSFGRGAWIPTGGK